MRPSPLKRQALWCGSIGCVLGMLLALNVIPIQSIGYVASTRIVANSSRMDRLLANTRGLIRDPSSDLDGYFSLNPISIDSRLAGQMATSHPEELVASQLSFYSQVPPSKASLGIYLESASAPERNDHEDVSIAKQIRQLRWEEEATLHSFSEVHKELVGLRPESEADRSFVRLQDEEAEPIETESPTHTVLGPPSPNLSRPLETAPAEDSEAAAAQPSFSMVSHQTLESISHLEGLRDQLSEQLESCRERMATLERLQLRATDHAKGILAFTQEWTVKPVAGRISLDKAVGLIVIGLTCWLGVGFLYLWLARRGGSDPNSLAIWLERMGVPHRGEWSATPWLSQVLQAPAISANAANFDINPTSERLKRWLEWIAISLALWILLRSMADPNWRALIIDQPLGGLSRLFIRI